MVSSRATEREATDTGFSVSLNDRLRAGSLDVSLDLYHRGSFIGSIVRSKAGSVYAYGIKGEAVGCYADVEAAGLALIERASRQPEAA